MNPSKRMYECRTEEQEDMCNCGCDATGDWCGQKDHIESHFGKLEHEDLDTVYERWCMNYGYKPIVEIGRSSSHCLNCGRNAFPDEGKHLTVGGYDKDGLPGCGITWIYGTTGYSNTKVEEVFPNLKPLPYERTF